MCPPVSNICNYILELVSEKGQINVEVIEYMQSQVMLNRLYVRLCARTRSITAELIFLRNVIFDTM